MIYSISPGSEGAGERQFKIYVPLNLEAGRHIGPLPEDPQFAFGDKSVKLEKLHDIYAISVAPFRDEVDARRGLTRLKAALLWLSLKHKLGIDYPKNLAVVKMFEEPLVPAEGSVYSQMLGVQGWEAVDGHYDARTAVVLPDDKRLLRDMGGKATVRTGIGFDVVEKCFREAAAMKNLDGIAQVPRLQLAIELYAASRFELTHNARFIALVTVLEAIVPEEKLPSYAQSAVEEAALLVKSVRDANTNRQSEEWRELDNLLSRVARLKAKGIGRAIREFVASTVSRFPELSDRGGLDGKIGDMYEVRSRLIHEGRASHEAVKDKVQFLDDLMPRLLSMLFLEQCAR